MKENSNALIDSVTEHVFVIASIQQSRNSTHRAFRSAASALNIAPHLSINGRCGSRPKKSSATTPPVFVLAYIKETACNARRAPHVDYFRDFSKIRTAAFEAAPSDQPTDVEHAEAPQEPRKPILI